MIPTLITEAQHWML